jgi:hypothetical protein
MQVDRRFNGQEVRLLPLQWEIQTLHRVVLEV